MFKLEIPAWLLVVIALFGMTTKVGEDGSISTCGVKWH